MRPVRTRRRVLESLAKTTALLDVPADSRLQHHALSEAVLHQIDATFVALVRQVGDAHGFKPESIQSLEDLVDQLRSRQLVSLEAQKLERLANDPMSWWNAYQAHAAQILCPAEKNKQTRLVLALRRCCPQDRGLYIYEPVSIPC